MQDHKSLHVAVMICATLVNTRAHTRIQTDSFQAVINYYSISSAI